MRQTFFVLGLALLLTACTPPVMQTDETLKTTDITLRSPSGASASFHVEIADNEASREKGLMFRKDLPAGYGMLFVFTEASPLSFWMKNTVIPLDIIFFDANRRVISFAGMEPCDSAPCPTTDSQGPAKYALEIPVDTIENLGITKGWGLEIK